MTAEVPYHTDFAGRKDDILGFGLCTQLRGKCAYCTVTLAVYVHAGLAFLPTMLV